MSKKTDKNAGQFPILHGLGPWLKTKKISPSVRGHKRMQKYLGDMRRDIIAQLGGPGAITPTQEALVESTIQALGVQLLAGAYVQKYSILRPDQARRGILEFQPLLAKSLVAYGNLLRQNLVALGLKERKDKEEEDLYTYIEKKYGGPDKPKGED